MNKNNDLQWQELKLNWNNLQVPNDSVTNAEDSLNKHFKIIRKKENQEILEFLFDICVGFVLLYFACGFFYIAFHFHWPLPTLETIDSGKEGLFSMSPKEVVKDFYSTLFIGIGFLLIGLGFIFLSWKFRIKIFKANIIVNLSNKDWISNYFVNKIKQSKIGQWLSIALLTFFGSCYLLTKWLYSKQSISQTEIIDEGLRQVNFNSMVATIGFFVVLPISIFCIAKWQEINWKKKQTRFLNNLDE